MKLGIVHNPRVKIFSANVDGSVGGQISLPASWVDSLLHRYLFPLTMKQRLFVKPCHIDDGMIVPFQIRSYR